MSNDNTSLSDFTDIKTGEGKKDSEEVKGHSEFPDGSSVEPDIVDTENLVSSTDSQLPEQVTSCLPDQSNDSDGIPTTHVSTIDSQWTTYFPYDTPYESQVDGIQSFVDALVEYDNMAMEGACGTGKTLIGLVAGIHLIRNRAEIEASYLTSDDSLDQSDIPRYKRIFIGTPVKQQLKQFIDEMSRINEQLPDYENCVRTVVLRGKKDMSPFSSVDHPPFDENSIYDVESDMRERTRKLIKFDSDIPLDWSATDIEPPAYSRCTYNWDDQDAELRDEAENARNMHRYDPNRAQCVVDTLKQEGEKADNRLTVNGVKSPYPDRVPFVKTVVADRHPDPTEDVDLSSEEQGHFDPFYAGIFAKNIPHCSFTDAPDSVIDKNILIDYCIPRGICPHEMMVMLASDAEVLIGNYYHILDPKTRQLTEERINMLNESTICILDEAHNLESAARDIFSDTIGINRLDRTKGDLEVIDSIMQSDANKLTEMTSVSGSNAKNVIDKVQNALKSDKRFKYLDQSTLQKTEKVIDEIRKFLLEKSDNIIENKYGDDWVTADRENLDDEQMSLGEPDSDNIDSLRKYLYSEFNEDILRVAYNVCRTSASLIDAISEARRSTTCGKVGSTLLRWEQDPNTTYFREIVIEQESKERALDASHRWTKQWTPKYQLYNCIPTNELRGVFSQLGSTLLMSATLTPLDNYVKTSGIKDCVDPNAVEESVKRRSLGRSNDTDYQTRNVKTEQYPLQFPKANRSSVIVDLPRYTASNRGPPLHSRAHMSDTRRRYMNVLKDIATSHGNILICMPSYTEAKWVGEILDDIEKEVLVDRSSSSKWTSEHLSQFFSGGEHSVMVTSTRGTITEGVDYDGDKLHTCAVVGIPILPRKPRYKAVQNAYESLLDDIDGFNAVKQIPAVRKARQAFGRVLRAEDEVGTRILIDERYGKSGFGGVNDILSRQEQREFQTLNAGHVETWLEEFWG